MKMTVRFISIAGLIGYAFLVVFLSWVQRAGPTGIQMVLVIIPVLYCLACLVTSYARKRSGVLLLVGILVHLLACLYLVMIWTRGREMPIWAAVVFGIYTLAWWSMYSLLPKA